MSQLTEITNILIHSEAEYEIIRHENIIMKTEDAEKYFDTTKAAPVFIIETESRAYALIVSFRKDKIDFKSLGKTLGFSKFKLADKDRVLSTTGYEIGAVPLIGHDLPCFIDDKILNSDFIYGGTGDKYHTLKIRPQDLLKLNNIVSIVNIPYK